MQRSGRLREVDTRRPEKPPPHKRIRIGSNKERHTDLYKNTHKSEINTLTNRQQKCPHLLTETGRKDKPNNEQHSKTDLGIPDEKQNFNNRGVYPVRTKYTCGQNVTLNRSVRVETGNQDIHNNLQEIGTTGNRPVCQPSNTPTGQICQLETRPTSSGNRCIPVQLDTSVDLCLPTIQADRQNTQQAPIASVRHDHCYTHLEITKLVPPAITDVNKAPTTSAKSQKPTDRPNRQKVPTSGTEKLQTSSMVNLREREQTETLPTNVANLLVHSRRSGTNNNYASHWRQFTRWCDKRKENPFHCNLNTILEYLTEMYDQGREYSTINGHRSAISLYHPLIDGIQVGKHPTTRQLLKAISNKRPPQPRLAAVWDVQQVIRYIKAMPENTELTTRQLAMKATILTALTCIPRASELHKLDTKYLEIKEDHLTFQIEGRVKHSRVGKKNPPLVLYRFQTDRHLCPVNTILSYLQATKEWRNPENTKVFLSNSHPHSQMTLHNNNIILDKRNLK